MVNDRTVRLTETGKARLADELATLRTERQPALASRIHDATEHGDVSDNSEYEDLKDEWQKMDARIRELELTLERAEVITPDATSGIAELGSTVTLRSDDGEEETWVLVSPEEANSLEGTISTESPVGRALFGRRAGDSTTVSAPSGDIVFTIVSIS
ncbi:MAG: transcription elongation factor GreA [Chloroflexota bacterium]|nr:transcription elongation factor GreA [Chloroflexota bacterium]